MGTNLYRADFHAFVNSDVLKFYDVFYAESEEEAIKKAKQIAKEGQDVPEVGHVTYNITTIVKHIW